MSALNWHLDLILGFITSFILLFIAGLTFQKYRTRKFRYLLYLSLVLLFPALINLIDGIAILFFLSDLFVYKNLLLIPMAFISCILIDTLTRDAVDPIKLVINSVLSTALIFVMDPTSITLYELSDGSLVYISLGRLAIVRTVILCWIFLNVLILLIQVHRHCPKSIKKYSVLSLMGGIILGPVNLIFIIGLINLPGSIFIVESTGFIMFTMGFFLKADLAFILPFKAIRLAVIKTDAAVPVYWYEWVKDDKLVDSRMFSSMLQAISSFVEESLDKGQIQEMKLPNAVMMIERNIEKQVACVLVSTKTSRLLRHCLILFLDRFLATFSLDNYSMTSQYNSAVKIVQKVFPFIPEY